MARRRKKTKRSRPAAFSLINGIEGVVLANAGTQLVFGTNAYNFLTDGWFGQKKTSRTDNSWEVSLHEIFQTAIGATDNYGASSSYEGLGGIIKYNLTHDAAPHVATLIATPILTRVLRKVMRKPIRMGNKALKMAGLRGMVRV
jgi:hypothetical protein